MEATTIDQLYPDVLVEIFSKLSAIDLKNCSLVCKDWNDVIGSSEATMKKFTIGFHLDRVHISYGHYDGHYKIDIRGILRNTDESYRNHQNMEISIYDRSLTQLPSLDRFILSQVKSLNLRFVSCERIELKKVVELVSRMPLLQVLMVEFFYHCAIDTSNTPFAHFTKLKQLKVQGHYPTGQLITKIFDFIKADNVTDLTLVDYAEYSDEEIDEVAAFIKSKRSLSKFGLSTRLFAQLHRRHDLSGMNLESLDVSNDSGTVDQPGIVVENIRKSLISNAHSLTSLSIHPRLMSKKVLVVIFNSLMKLTTLQISGFDGSWMNDLSPNDISHNLSLKTFKVNRVGAIGGLKTILQRAPQLKNLKLGGFVTNVIMKEVETSAPGLVDLEISSLNGSLSGDQRLNELKSLKIMQFKDVGCLASLLERCPKVEDFEFHCGFFVDPNSLVIDVLLQQKTLKHLRFGRCWPAVRWVIFDTLKTNYGNLRSLELRSPRGKVIMFDFPENPAEWNVEEQERRLSALKW